VRLGSFTVWSSRAAITPIGTFCTRGMRRTVDMLSTPSSTTGRRSQPTTGAKVFAACAPWLGGASMTTLPTRGGSVSRVST
jgi:hypothetical protein